MAYTCRGVCQSKLGENFYWTPFDVLPIPLKIELSHIVYKKDTYIRFNTHVHDDMGVNLCLKDEVDQMPEFNVCFNSLKAEIRKEEKSDE